MKQFSIINTVKGSFLVIFCALFIASCDKGLDHGGVPLVDYARTATTQFVMVGKTSIAYRVLGNKGGIPLVMVNALGNSMDDWDPAVTNGLAQQYKVIIFDIEGVGSSDGSTPDSIGDMAAGVVDFIHALGYSRVNLLGFSMGSFIGQRIALTNPGLLNRIILTGTGPKGAVGLANLPNILAGAAGLTPEQVFLVSFFAPSAESQKAGELSYDRIQARTINRDAPESQVSAGAELTAVLGWAQPDLGALSELKRIAKPVLIAQGEKDLLVPVVNAINMADSIRGARLIVFPDAGHGAIFQYHEVFVAAATEFLGR